MAAVLGEDKNWFWDVGNGMDQEGVLILVYGPGDNGIIAFTDFGVVTLGELVETYKPILTYSSAPKCHDSLAPAYAEWIR